MSDVKSTRSTRSTERFARGLHVVCPADDTPWNAEPDVRLCFGYL